MSQPALDFTGGPPPRLPREKRRPLLIGGRAPIARQASADGAQLNAPRRETQCAELLAYIESRLTDGVTDAEIERDLGWKPNIVTARRNDLMESGDVVRWPDRRRRSVTSGVPVAVWVAKRYAPAAEMESTSGVTTTRRLTDPEIDGRRERRTADSGVTSPGGENPVSTSTAHAPSTDSMTTAAFTQALVAACQSPVAARTGEIRAASHGSVGVDGDTRRSGKTPLMYFSDRSREANALVTEQRSDPVNAGELTLRREPHYEVLSTDRKTGPTGSVGNPGQNRSAAITSHQRLTADTVREVPYGTRVLFADGTRGQVRFVTRKHELAVYAFDRRELVTLRPEQLEDWRDVEGELREVAP